MPTADTDNPVDFAPPQSIAPSLLKVVSGPDYGSDSRRPSSRKCRPEILGRGVVEDDDTGISSSKGQQRPGARGSNRRDATELTSLYVPHEEDIMSSLRESEQQSQTCHPTSEQFFSRVERGQRNGTQGFVVEEYEGTTQSRHERLGP
jgi:hypothetical protein